MADLEYIQKGGKARYMKKDGSMGASYNFVSHDQVTAKVHPLLVKHGIVILPTVEELAQDGNRTVVKLLVMLVNVDNPADNLQVRSVGYGLDDGDKGPGKAVSYAYKYALLKTFCLETGDDPDEVADSKHEPAKCLEFDETFRVSLSPAESAKLDAFLEQCCTATGKHAEDIKRQAVKNPERFTTGFQKFKAKS